MLMGIDNYYTCKYDNTLKNLNNFDLCLFFDIPVSSKTICLCGFDNNNNSDNSDNSNSQSQSQSDPNQLNYKDKIISLITNSIINNYKTRTHYTNIVIHYYSCDKNKKFNSSNIKPNKYFSSNSKFEFNNLDSIKIMLDYLDNLNQIKNLNYLNNSNTQFAYENNKIILSILILDSVNLTEDNEKKIILDLVSNFNKYKLWIICDCDNNFDKLTLFQQNELDNFVGKFEYKIYSSNSTLKQIENYYINDFVECIGDIKYIFNTFNKFKNKKIHLVTLRQKIKKSSNLQINLDSELESDTNITPKIMGFIPYKITKPISNSFCESDTTVKLKSNEHLNNYKEFKINVFNESKRFNLIKEFPLVSDDLSESLSQSSLSQSSLSNNELLTEDSKNIKLSKIKSYNTSTDYMCDYLKNSEKIKVSTNNKNSHKNKSISSNSKTNPKANPKANSTQNKSTKLSNQDIFIKNTSEKVIKSGSKFIPNLNPNPTNIEFFIGTNVKIKINFQ